MKQRIAFALIIIAFAMSGALHYREYRKSQEISDILRIQAEIEFKRTSLMVVYQEVLQSVVKELERDETWWNRSGKSGAFQTA